MVYPRRSRAPWWFVALLTVAWAVTVRVCAPASLASGGVGVPHAPPSLAWWAFLGVIIDIVWKGVEVAARVTLQILGYSVNLLWRFARNIANGAHELASFAFKGLKQAWSLLRGTYEHVLKPAWQKVWTWVDRVESWLQRTFGPLLSWLRRVRDWILTFYESYIRPILDVIELSRRALRVLGSLGLEWARALDRRLGTIEDWIDRRFQDVLGTINDVINVVNRVVTADGLFQKLAYVRTYARDVKDLVNQSGWGLHRPITGDERDALQKAIAQRSLSVVARDMRQYLRDGTGPDAEWLNQTAAAVRVWLGGLP
jgi:hypothetical protein